MICQFCREHVVGAGIADELVGIDLGDRRLNERSKAVIEALATDPEASVNAACSTWKETIAAYRLFDNPAVTPEAILEPHYQATLDRLREHPVVLIVQDTTELDFSKHPPADASCLNKADRFGVYDHTHLAITPDRVCLGVVGMHLFDRDAESLGRTRERRNLPIEEKESFRWLEGYRLASKLAARAPDTQLINVADREADIYDIFVEAGEQPDAADFIIRSKEERCTLEKDANRGPAAYRRVRDEVLASDVRFRRTISLPQTHTRAKREATLEVRAQTVTIKPPHARSSLPPVTCQIVHAREVNGPHDGTDVEWWLITSLPIETVEQIECVIDYYAARWVIEVYFRVLKTGCRVEEIQLGTMPRVKNCLAFYKIIAWRTLQLTYLSRECPNLPCTAVFDDCEWQPVWRITTKQELPNAPPDLQTFVKLLASLGGYNNRRTERPPGPQPIWVGLRRMTDFTLAWQTFPQSPESYV